MRAKVVAAALVCSCASAIAQTVSIGVFGLFHPAEVWVRPGGAEPLCVEDGVERVKLEGAQAARFRLGQVSSLSVTSCSGSPADLVVLIPGKIERRFRGVLTMRPRNTRELIPVIEMDLEAAVASVIAAESAPGAGIEALKAQAVVARSFFVAYHGKQQRHPWFEFCDTTHCQFVRELPGSQTLALSAAQQTRGLTLTYDRQVFAPFYSAACGGHTRSLEGAASYPYFAVACDYCLRHPADGIRGHRLGLCQQGAFGMAAQGASFRTILNHYFPSTAIEARPTGVSQMPSKFTKKQSTVMAGNAFLRNAAARSSSAK